MFNSNKTTLDVVATENHSIKAQYAEMAAKMAHYDAHWVFVERSHVEFDNLKQWCNDQITLLRSSLEAKITVIDETSAKHFSATEADLMTIQTRLNALLIEFNQVKSKNQLLDTTKV